MPDEDRKQIGLTDDGKAAVARLTDNLGWFDEAQDAGTIRTRLRHPSGRRTWTIGHVSRDPLVA